MSTPSSRAEALLADLGIPPERGSLAELALTHRSFGGAGDEDPADNERLEFLGDAVLGAVVADILYSDYPHLTEGEMTRSRATVVGMPGLARAARDLGIGAHLRLSPAEEATGGREKDSLLADTLEALLGALYLDEGISAVVTFVRSVFADSVQNAVGTRGENYKGHLQEEVVARVGARPRYEITSSGPEHNKRFTAGVFVSGELCGKGTGRSKREAEQMAAAKALERLDEVAPRLGVSEGAEQGGKSARAS